MNMENNVPAPQLEDFTQFGEATGLTPEQIAEQIEKERMQMQEATKIGNIAEIGTALSEVNP